MKIGCCISLDHVKLAKAFGYDYVELSAREIMKMNDTIWDKKKREILRNKISVIGFSAFADENTKIIGPDADEKVWIAYLHTILERASQLHVQYIGIGAPNARMIPATYDYKKATKEMEYFLLKAANLASNYAITILYEALNPSECNFGNHTIEIYNTIKKINHPNLKMVYDVYHAINSNEVYEDARPCFHDIKHIHINSWNQKLQRYYLFDKDALYLKDFFIFLTSIPYNGTISIEAFDADFVNTGASSVSIIKEAIASANHSI